jgi:hypothetical protein
VFERHPKPDAVHRRGRRRLAAVLYREIDDRISPTAELFLGSWKYPMKPSEYLARNVRGTPLSAGNDSPIAKIIEELPDDMVVFSSDFPHFEGFTDPIGHYAKELDPAETRAPRALLRRLDRRRLRAHGRPDR